MLGWVKRLFKPEGAPPLLVRVRNAHGPIEGNIGLRATWRPSGKTWSTTTTSAQGLCIVPWAGGDCVDLQFIHETGSAKLRAEVDDALAGQARQVVLDDQSRARM